MHRLFVMALIVACWSSLAVAADDYKAEKIEAAPPKDALSPEIAKVIGNLDFKVTRGERVVCEVWPCKEVPISSGKTSDTVLYPLTPGQLIGVVRFPRKTTDFRQQEIEAGVYTLRYGQQPVDGAHVGTSPTRDFLLLLPAAQDKTPETIVDYKTLTKTSAASAGTNHPAILLLQKAADEGEPVGIRHDEEKDWWILRFATATQGKANASLRFEVVVVGHAAE